MDYKSVEFELNKVNREYKELVSKMEAAKARARELQKQARVLRFDENISDEVRFDANCKSFVSYENVFTNLKITPKTNAFFNELNIDFNKKLIDLGPDVEVIIRRK